MMFLKRPKKVTENKWIIIVSLIVFALIFLFSPAEPMLYDDALYADIAKNLLKNGCFCSNFQVQANTAPMFPLLEAGFMLVFGDNFIKPLLAFIAAFALLSSYVLILKISNSKKTALFSSLFFFSTPLVAYNSLLALMDMLFSGLVFLSIWSFLKLTENGTKANILACSALTSVTLMTRFTGYLLFPIFILFFLLQRRKLRIGLKPVLALLVLVVAFTLPWSIWRFGLASQEIKIAGELISGMGYGHLVFRLESFFYNGDPVNMMPLSIDVNVPIQLVNFVRILATLLAYVTPLMTLVFSYFLTKRKSFKKNKYDNFLIIWFLAFFVFHIIGFSYFGARYAIAFALPIVFVFTRFIETNMQKRRILAVSLIALQILSLIGISYLVFRLNLNANDTQIFEQAGVWIKENTPLDSKVLPFGAPPGALIYYGERKVVGANGTTPNILVRSNFGYSTSIDQYMSDSNEKFVQVQEFSDPKYYVKIYQRV